MPGINHERVVVHGDKGLADDWNKDHKQKGNHDCEQFQHLNHVLENRTTYPAGPVPGQIIFRSDFPNAFVWTGTSWASLTPVATVVVAADGTGNFLTIQEGIDALPAGGGVVYVKEGTYVITAAITITDNNVAVIGAGKATKITTTLDINVIEVTGVSGVLIEKVYVYGAGIGKTNNSGIGLTNVSNSSVINCWIENCGSLGIYCDGADFNLLSGNNITTCTLSGIYITNSDYNIINSNQIYVCEYGLNLYLSDHNLIQNNILYSNTKAGSRSFTTNYNVYANNQVHSNIREGLSLFDCDNCIISNNLIKDNDVNNTTTYDGITLTASDYNLIEGNRCIDNDRYEINISDAGSNENLIIGNNCQGADHVGTINNAGTDTQMARNIGGAYYWSTPATDFTGWVHGNQGTSVDYHYGEAWLESDQDTATFMCPVLLPDGATVTGAVVYGSISDEQWELRRMTLNAVTPVSMATANFNTEDTSINNAKIDNSLYSYYFLTSTIDDTDRIYGARITYTF